MTVLKVLARGIAALAALAATAWAGPALAGSADPTPFSASFEEGGTISFQLDKHRGKRKVHDIAITDMAANCDDRNAELDFTIYGDTRVLDDRSFAVRSEDASGKGKAVVRAEFSRKFKHAEGTARIYGKFELQDGWSECETGKQEFVARITE
jgi:hypothetical protein